MNTQYSKLLKNVLGHFFLDLLSRHWWEYGQRSPVTQLCLFLRLTAVVFFPFCHLFHGLYSQRGAKMSVTFERCTAVGKQHTHNTHTSQHSNPKWNCESTISILTIGGNLIFELASLSFSFLQKHRSFLTLFFLLDFVRHGVLPGVWHEKTHPRTFHKKKIGDWHCLDYVNSCLPILDPHSCLWPTTLQVLSEPLLLLQHMQIYTWSGSYMFLILKSIKILNKSIKVLILTDHSSSNWLNWLVSRCRGPVVSTEKLWWLRNLALLKWK